MIDRFAGHPCAGSPYDLHYNVFFPTTPGTYPIVFGIKGSGFNGTSGCPDGKESFEGLDYLMQDWASQGFVAVNIEYHGTVDGLYGDLTYPGTAWGDIADGTTELNIKKAIEFFLANNPGQYGASESAGIVIFGSSSGGYSAYMLATTGVRGHAIAAAIGLSGFPDWADAGPTPEAGYEGYMRTTAGTDVFNFGDAMHRVNSGSPPQYIANDYGEVANYQNAINYWNQCTQLGVTAWLRIVDDGAAHGMAYAFYQFTGQPPEQTSPPATVGMTVIDDSIGFAKAMLPTPTIYP